MGLFDRVISFFNDTGNGSSRRDVEEFVRDARIFIARSKASMEEVERQRSMLEMMTHHMGGMVWIKRWDPWQEEYLYEFANRPHCETFFNFPVDCLQDCNDHVQGRSDIDLLNDFRERTGLRHSYGDMCFSTDKHATEMAILHHITNGESGATSCHYLECGYVGDKELVLEVTKTPLFDSNFKLWETHTYSVGNAVDVSRVCTSRLEFARQCVERGEGERLQPGVFWLYPSRGECELLKEEVGDE
jgi:hypothetical protein